MVGGNILCACSIMSINGTWGAVLPFLDPKKKKMYVDIFEIKR